MTAPRDIGCKCRDNDSSAASSGESGCAEVTVLAQQETAPGCARGGSGWRWVKIPSWEGLSSPGQGGNPHPPRGFQGVRLWPAGTGAALAWPGLRVLGLPGLRGAFQPQ